MESFRRNARFVRDTLGYFRLSSLNSVDELMDMWMKGTSGGRVTMFNILSFILFFLYLKNDIKKLLIFGKYIILKRNRKPRGNVKE